jgi:thiamine phosphate synthase YjbQ (UPF0047 family)
MASTKVKTGLAVVLMAGVSAPLVIQHQAGSRLREELAVLRQRNAGSTEGSSNARRRRHHSTVREARGARKSETNYCASERR